MKKEYARRKCSAKLLLFSNQTKKSNFFIPIQNTVGQTLIADVLYVYTVRTQHQPLLCTVHNMLKQYHCLSACLITECQQSIAKMDPFFYLKTNNAI